MGGWPSRIVYFGESGQAWTALTSRNACRQVAAGGDTTAGLVQTMTLILDNARPELKHIPDTGVGLAPTAAAECIATATACLRHSGDRFIALLRGNRGGRSLMSFGAALGPMRWIASCSPFTHWDRKQLPCPYQFQRNRCPTRERLPRKPTQTQYSKLLQRSHQLICLGQHL